MELLNFKLYLSWSISQRHLTEFQIIQFIIDLIYVAGGVAWHNFCFWGVGYALSMLYLFTDFYVKTYCRKKNNPIVENGTKKTH